MKDMWMLAAGGLVFLTGSQHKKDHQVRRNNGKVKEHPDTEYDRSRKLNILASTLAGAASLLAFKAKGAMVPGLRRNIFFGGSFALGVGASVIRGDDIGAAVISNSLATAAGYIAYKGIVNNADKGIKALKDDMLRNGAKAAVNNIESAIINAKNKFPLLGQMITKESAGLTGALITIPVAHSIIQRQIKIHKLRYSDNADASFIPSTITNQAGQATPSYTPTEIMAQEANRAEVSFKGSLNTYYNSAQAFEEI